MDDKSKKSTRSTTAANQASSSLLNKVNLTNTAKNAPHITTTTSSISTNPTTTKNSTSSIHMTSNENEYDDDFYLNNDDDDDEDVIDDYDDEEDYANDDDDDEDIIMEEDDTKSLKIDSNHNKNTIVTTNRSVSNAINLPPVNKPSTSNQVSSSLSASLMTSKNKDESNLPASTSLSSQRASGYLGNQTSRKRNVELDDEFKYEVLTPDKIVNHMIDCIKEVNQVLELPPTTTRILLHHFRWDKEKLMERFYDGDQDRLFKEAHIVSPFKSVNSGGGGGVVNNVATSSNSSSKKVGFILCHIGEIFTCIKMGIFIPAPNI
jgi:hypothetical protein